MAGMTTEDGLTEIDTNGLAELAVSIWRIERRAQRSADTPENVRMACETACDRLRAIGIELRDLVGAPYDENMRVRVVQHDGGSGTAHVAECLSPAVYLRNELILPAEVIVKGRTSHE